MKLLYEAVSDLKPLRNGSCGTVLADVDRHRPRLLDVHQPGFKQSVTLEIFLHKIEPPLVSVKYTFHR